MAQKKNTGSKSDSSAKKAGTGKAKTASGNKKNSSAGSASKALDSVRSGSQRQVGRAQDAAKKAAGRTAKPTESKKDTAKNTAKTAPDKKSSSAPKSSGKASSGSKSKKKSGKFGTEAWQRMAIVAVFVLVGVVIAIQTVSCANSQVDSRQAVMVTLSDNIETNGVAIRNERIITSERQGVIVSTVENGGKVSKGETVANIFNSTDAARAYERMEEIEESLEQFDSMSTAGEDSASEVTVLEKAIWEELLNISGLIYDGDASAAVEGADDLLYLLNKTQVAIRAEEDFSEKVDALEKELAHLQSQYPDKPGQLNSPLSGYYISTADGYEALLSTDICASLTPEKLDQILELRSEPDDRSVVGKIADDYIWYMACEVSAKDADRLAKNEDGSYIYKNYKLYLTYSELDSITAKLVGVNTGADANRKVLIFECSYMVSELATVRIQPVTIELSSYSGLEVSSKSVTSREVTVSSSDVQEYDVEAREALAKAICPEMFSETETQASGSDAPTSSVDSSDPYAVAARRLLTDYSSDTKLNNILKGIEFPDEITYTQQGVFIVWGDEIKFKRILELYRTGTKVLCKYNVDDGFLKMYDNVVDKPGEVYDGQIIHGK